MFELAFNIHFMQGYVPCQSQSALKSLRLSRLLLARRELRYTVSAGFSAWVVSDAPHGVENVLPYA